jgi:hypothetical protein
MMSLFRSFIQYTFLLALSVFMWGLFSVSTADAATLRLSPETGVYTAGSTFTASILINTQGKPINAADAELGFNPKEISVVSVNRGSSIFNLWTLEPTFSNSAGTISFGGGSPAGYTGSNGNILTITFIAAGTPKVTFKSGSILAADGQGTNVLTSMNGGTYTIQAKTEAPPPEYVPPANTPLAPNVTSSTHTDEDAWYKETTAKLSWTVPNDVTAVRTLLDESKSTVPTIVYEEPITSREITDLPQGTSYFHIQFKNADGWGRVTHFALNVDSEAPSEFTISEESGDTTNPSRTLVFTIKDTSPITKYTIQIDGGEVIEYIDTERTGTYKVPTLSPGRHTVVVEAFDSAGNSRVASHSFDVQSFERPVFTEYPDRVNAGVIPALRGTTRPNARVEVKLMNGDREFDAYTVESNGEGNFTFIPDEPLPIGVYDITAIAFDEHGAMSEPSQTIRMIVEKPGYLAIGSFMVSLLSVLVPLIALLFILVFGTWYLYHRLRVWRKKVMRETTEAEDKLRTEIDGVLVNLHANVEALKESRKTKLTRAELTLIEGIENDLRSAQAKIKKEITDIEDVVQ